MTAWVVAALGFIGFADSAYLTAGHYLKLPVPCTITHGCDIVLSSQYSTIGPIPISLIGALYYLVILVLAITFAASENPKSATGWLLFAITAAGLAVSGYLFYLQVAVIHAVCQYCLGSAITTLIAFLGSAALAISLRRPRV